MKKVINKSGLWHQHKKLRAIEMIETEPDI